ncbi:MAG: dTDP-glucose 4,6-dehydratase [Kofleriaceae bacterium]
MTTRYLVTGGAGFIGGSFVRELLTADGASVVVVLDKLTYAGRRDAVPSAARFVHGDIGDRGLVRKLLADVRPQVLVHFAAESHVDRSIDGPEDFVQTNVVGTFHLLEESRRYLANGGAMRFVHVSTDEVFGALGHTGVFTESSSYAPRSPYAASKAASDHFVSAYVHTYGFPAILTNCSNNYGPYQYPEKLIPLTITNALAGKRLPVYAKGENVRDWIHVADHCAALRAVCARGRVGETYVIGARNERRNIDLVRLICAFLDQARPRPDGIEHASLIELVDDRPGHDFRYAIDPSKIERELGWRPTIAFEDGLRSTITWYAQHG